MWIISAPGEMINLDNAVDLHIEQNRIVLNTLGGYLAGNLFNSAKLADPSAAYEEIKKRLNDGEIVCDLTPFFVKDEGS